VTDNVVTVSPGSARKQEKRERERIRFARKRLKGIPKKEKNIILREVKR